MMISCPRCKTMVSDDIMHCTECGYSIKNYIENKKLMGENNIYNEVAKEASDEVKSNVALKERKIAGVDEKDNIEDNILKFLSNIKIVKDENYKPDDDELDDNMHSFLVEALNESYKLRSVRTVIKNPKEYLGLGEEDKEFIKKEELDSDSKGDLGDNIINISDKEGSVKEKEVPLIESDNREKDYNIGSVKDNLKLEEPEDTQSLGLVELSIEPSLNATNDKTEVNNKKNNNLELNTHELEIIHKRKIKLPKDFEIRDGIIKKEILEDKNYDFFYDTIAGLRVDTFNKKAILTVATVAGVFVIVVAFISGLIMG